MNSENTHGDKLARSFNLYQAITQMKDYTPASKDLNLESFLAFINSVDEKNLKLASVKNDYSLAVKTRQELFFNDDGVKKRLAYVNAYCKSRVDLKKEVSLISRLTARMKTVKKPKNITDEKKRSSGEQSYGDFMKMLGELIEIVRQIPEYNPPNKLISLQSLEEYRIKITDASKIVGDKYYDYSMKVKERIQLYTELKDYMLRIKNTIKSQYGMKSNEYLSIKGIRV